MRGMEKFFNIAGPCNPTEHYMLPALDRLPEVRRLVARRQYFVIHAPRQTGKTTAIKALVREVNAKGDMVALYCTLETLQGATDPARASSAIASLLRFNASNVMPEVFKGESNPSCVCEAPEQYAAESLAVRETRVRRIVEPLISGQGLTVSRNSEDFRYVIDLGLLREDEVKRVVPANPMYAEIIGRYLTRDEQDDMQSRISETPWVKDDGLDMPGLMAAFQQFWRENSGADRDIMGYRESVPHIVLMAFLQRVTNGGGHINREMALGTGRLDLCVEFRGGRYAIEVKTSANFQGEKSYAQCAKYLDSLGLAEGWMPVFEKSKEKTWDEKIYSRDEMVDGKTIHVIGLC